MLTWTINSLTPIFDFSMYNLFVSSFFENHTSTNGFDAIDSLSVLHAATPNVKLYYPEPFIATPSFVHDDIWFVHIVIYQYWLWFIFVTIIVFFFLAFLVTIRWCNLRHRPVRETRGVSRSKCGDLITATIPVSWASSIIIHESTDAIELQDGFGSTELAVGIRAYQWGWEYYYPKDLQSSLKSNSSKFLGNSLFNSTSLDKDASFLRFKNNLMLSSINTTSASSIFHRNASLISTKTLELLADFNGSSSSTIETSSSNLATSTRLALLNPTSYFDEGSTGDFNVLSAYFDPNFKTSNHEVNFLNSLSFYSPFVNLSALGDLQFRLTSDLGFIDYSPDFNFPLVTWSTDQPQLVGCSNQLAWNFFNSSLFLNYFLSFNKLQFSLLIDQDFKRWASAELLDDSLSPSLDPVLSHQFLNLTSPVTPLFTNKFILNPSNTFDLTSLEFTTHIVFDYANKALLSSPSINFFGLSSFEHKLWFSQSRSNSFFFEKCFINPLTTLIKNFQFNFSPKSSFIVAWGDIMSLFSSNFFKFDSFSNSPQFGSLSLSTSNLISTTPFDLLTNARNVQVFKNAFWKVFKSTLEEERSSFSFSNYSNLDFHLPLVSSNPVNPFLNFSKTAQTKFSRQLLTQRSFEFTSKVNTLINPRGFFSLGFPFSFGFESDLIRYSWFDWYSLRNSISTRALDTSVFNLHASKDYNFTFSKAPHLDLINRADNFFLKYIFIRHLSLPTYAIKPFLMSKFFNLNSFFFFNTDSILSWAQTKLMLNQTLWYFNDVDFNIQSAVSNTTNFFNFSYVSSNNRMYPESKNLRNSSSEVFGQLSSVLSRKAYILSNLTGVNIRLDSELISSDLFATIRSLSKFTSLGDSDSSFNSYSTSFKRTLSFLRFKNLSITDQPSPKNPFKSLRKGITNMIRIQADKAVAMPTDTRLQILAVSKDIIHSWSIPSAGVKIDCIPGYSSHKVVVFSLSGIYWGQCMEICGRFHHWMPIVVYFMRRDLFCLWCIHFIYKSPQYNPTLQFFGGQLSSNARILTPWTI